MKCKYKSPEGWCNNGDSLSYHYKCGWLSGECPDREEPPKEEPAKEEMPIRTEYVIDYGFGFARLYTPETDWESRFYTLADQCFGIRKSIEYAKLVTKNVGAEPFGKIFEGEYERLEHHGDVIAWNKEGEKIKSEWDMG